MTEQPPQQIYAGFSLVLFGVDLATAFSFRKVASSSPFGILLWSRIARTMSKKASSTLCLVFAEVSTNEHPNDFANSSPSAPMVTGEHQVDVGHFPIPSLDTVLFLDKSSLFATRIMGQ